MKRMHSMRFRVKLITMTSIGVMLLMTILYLQGFERMSQERSNALFESSALEVEHRLASQLQNIASTARMIAYSSTLQTYLLNESATARMQVMAPSIDLMQNMIETNPSIHDILLYSKSGRLLFARGGLRSMAHTMLSEYGVLNDTSLEEPFFSRVYMSDGAVPLPHAFYVMPIYNSLPGQFDMENAGLCAIQFKVDALCNNLETREQPAGFIAIVAEGGAVLSSSIELPQEDAARLMGVGPDQARLSIGAKDYLARSHADANTGWQIATAAPVSELERDMLPLRRLGQVLFFSAVVALSILMLASVRSISGPLGKLLLDIDRIGKAGEGFRMQVPGSHELALIAEQINRTLERVDRSAKTEKEVQAALYESSIARQRAELLSYRSQINPHFLYNTLECIRSMAQLSGAEGIERICLSMSRMFRYAVRDDDRVTVADELRHVHDYYTVMTERMNGIYNLIEAVTPQAQERAIQKMILQPIIENTIKHGFAEKEPPCNICIQGFVKEDGTLVLRISDNGVGLSPQALACLQAGLQNHGTQAKGDKASIGLSNIDHRLRLSFGSRYALSIRSRQGCYTCVELLLPLAGGV